LATRVRQLGERAWVIATFEIDCHLIAIRHRSDCLDGCCGHKRGKRVGREATDPRWKRGGLDDVDVVTGHDGPPSLGSRFTAEDSAALGLCQQTIDKTRVSFLYCGDVSLDVVGLKEIAERLGVKQQTAAAWRHRGLLPPPEGKVSGAPAWQWRTIEEWAAETGRLGGCAEFVASTSGRRVIDGAEVEIGPGVVVRQVSQPFPQPMEGGRVESHVRFEAASDGRWYQLSHDAYLRGIGAAETTAARLGKALVVATAAVGAIVVLSEAAKQAGPPA
jgi:hypothetical protein